MIEALIQATGLAKAYGDTTAVAGIDLSIDPGEVFGLLGPNGAGKTTTILMLLGLTEPDAGTVRVCGLDPTRDPLTVKRQVGYLPDAIGFYEHLTGRQNLRYTARLNDLPDRESGERIDRLMDQVGLTPVADRPVGGYSRGMRQRLGIADTLVKDPLVAILDEPTTAIDPRGVAEMQRLITDLAREDGRAVLLSSHLLHQVQAICDRMAIFVAGRIVAEGTAAELGGSLGGERARYEIATSAAEDDLQKAVGGLTTLLERSGAGRWIVEVPKSETRNLFGALVKGGVDVGELRDLGSDLDHIYQQFFEPAEEVIA